MAESEQENNWDDLADEFGLFPDKPAPKAEPPKPATTFADLPTPLFDPGPDEIIAEPEELEDLEDAGEEGDDESDEGTEPGQEGGKKKRKRRRRRKKKSGQPEGEQPTLAETVAPAPMNVEEGEAPGEVEDDEEDAYNAPNIIDEEIVAAIPKQEWKIMPWAELIGKLYRPN